MADERIHPFMDMLEDYASSDPARFHMPGHKGEGIPGFLKAPTRLDVTELKATDDLHAPSRAILALEGAYAAAYGARGSFLLVNGSTAGVAAMLLSIGLEKRLVLGRDCHRSAIAGAALAGHDVRFVHPDPSGIVTADAVNAALAQFPAGAVLLTSPNYYGICADVPEIARVCHSHGAMLLVDCAHGAHFPFSPSLCRFVPREADLYCVSVHKTLRALTQTAVLHVNHGCPIPEGRIRRMLALIETSSPSFLLTASLEGALTCAKSGEWAAHEARIRAVRGRLEGTPGISLVQNDDFTRLVIGVTDLGIDGYEAANALSAAGVIVEMADLGSLVLISSPADPDEWYERLYAALTALVHGVNGPLNAPYDPPPLPAGERVLGVREACLGDAERVPLKDAPGRVAAMAAGIYPPGVAALFPGERITQEAVRLLLEASKAGAELFGVEDRSAYCVKKQNEI